MKVLKFGGTSVGKPERMKSVANIIQNGGQNVVVLSALSGTTNTLVEIADDLYDKRGDKARVKIVNLQTHYQIFIKQLFEIGHGIDASKNQYQKALNILHHHFRVLNDIARNQNFSIKEEKILLAQGELLSTQLFQAYLEQLGLNSVLIPALNFMKINQELEPDFDFIKENILDEIAKKPDKTIYLTQGYICRNVEGSIDNLQRGGSDYTASILGAVLDAEEIQIWTDIDGMHNNDPRYVENTQPVAELSFDEAAELAYFGAKILHPSSIRPAQMYNVPVKLLNTLEPEITGTIIKNTVTRGEKEITAIAAKDDITAIKVKSSRMLLAYGFLRQIFEIFERYKTPIDMITTSEVAVSLTIDNEHNLKSIVEELENLGTVEVDKGQSIICIVGNFVAEKEGTALQVLSALKNIPLRMISSGGSKHNISVLIKTEYKIQALQALSENLF